MIEQALTQISVERMRGHIRALEGVRHPLTAPEALERAADYVRDELRSLGHQVSEQQFIEDDEPYRNIIAMQPGRRYPEQRVIVLAHYDTELETPGANDNASGIAAVLELARVLRPLAFERSICFVGVSLEENKPSGGYLITRGSRALATYAREQGWEIVGVINFEEIAYAGDDVPQQLPPGLPIEPPKAGNFIAAVGNQHSAKLVQGFMRAIAQYNIPLPCLPLVVPGTGKLFPDTRRSDHAPFWDDGHRAIMLTDTGNFRTPHYHQPSDTLETLNLDFAAAVCRAGGGLVAELAGVLG